MGEWSRLVEDSQGGSLGGSWSVRSESTGSARRAGNTENAGMIGGIENEDEDRSAEDECGSEEVGRTSQTRQTN